MKTRIPWLGTLFACLLVLASPALALQCDLVVEDEANLLKGGLVSVEAAATQLENLGASVRVRTFNTFGDAGNLDRYVDTIRRSCPSWQATDGGVKNNLVVIAVEVAHREIGYYYGSLWKSALDRWWQRIKDDTIRPRLRDADFTRAFTDGLQATIRRIEADQEALRAPPPPVVQGPTIVREAADLSGLWSVLGWLLVIGAIGSGVFFVMAFLQKKARDGEARRKAQAGAKGSRMLCSNAVRELSEKIIIAKARVNTFAQEVSESDSKTLTDSMAVLVAECEGFATDYSRLAGLSVNDPGVDGLTASEYERISAVFSAFSEKIGPIDRRINEFDTKIDKARTVARETPQKITDAETAIASANGVIAKVVEAGFMVTSMTAQVAQANEHLAASRRALAKRSFVDALALALQSGATALDAELAAQALPDMRNNLDTGANGLDLKIRQTEQQVEETRTVFERIAREYAEVSWHSIAGNGSECQKNLLKAKDALKKARTAASMKNQEWDVARESLKTATNLTSSAQVLLQAIVSLAKALDEAREKAPSEIDAAHTDITKARAYLRAHTLDVDKKGLEARLSNAEDDLQAARRGLSETQPDYLKVVKRALAANHAADEILAAATEQHETMQRKRRNLASQLEEARRSVRVAENYIASHRGDTGKKAIELVENAVLTLKEVERASTIDEQIRLAVKADEYADLALEKAKSKVAENERRRQRSEESGYDTVIVGPSSRSSPSHSSGGSFGGSFGGGSSSFGSSGGFGGGSSKW